MPRKTQPVAPVEITVELPAAEFDAQLDEHLARFLFELTEPDHDQREQPNSPD